jgi:N-acetylgalactosamine-N,N'-diacetylbacillosaminyl-diphospho-undecaprenol 4-alpha-N-acetylgalactosaminyltransferase
VSGRRRILFVINSLAGGGAERVMTTLLRHSEAECSEFDVTLALLDDEPAAYSAPDWVRVRQLDGRKSFLPSVTSLRRLVAELAPDLSLSFLTRSNVANVLTARRPAIISERANTSAHFPPGIRGEGQRAMVRLLYPRAARVIAVSDGVADDLRRNFGVAAEKLVTIPNPVDAAAIIAKSELEPELAIDGPYILAAGRLVPSKNFDMLIRAYAKSGDERRLVIFGEGPQRAALMAAAAACGVAERVSLPGFVANPYPLMKRADLFVLSSNAEGFPNALVEAMTLGVPVVATNCASGPSEILAETSRDQISALTFAPHGVIVPANAADAMAEALTAMADPERRALYGAKAAARAATYSVDQAKERYWGVIRDVLAEARAR